MKRILLVTLVVTLGCNGGKKTESPICKMTKGEADVTVSKIDAELAELRQAAEKYDIAKKDEVKKRDAKMRSDPEKPYYGKTIQEANIESAKKSELARGKKWTPEKEEIVKRIPISDSAQEIYASMGAYNPTMENLPGGEVLGGGNVPYEKFLEIYVPVTVKIKQLKELLKTGSNPTDIILQDKSLICFKALPLLVISQNAKLLAESIELKSPFELLKIIKMTTEFNIKYNIINFQETLNKHQEKGLANKFNIAKMANDNSYNKILACIMDNTRQKLSKISKSKYSKTLELYSLTVQMIDLWKKPKDSPEANKLRLSELQLDFEKTLPLAELEWQ